MTRPKKFTRFEMAPSTIRFEPVVNEEAGLARNVAAFAISCGVVIRPLGFTEIQAGEAERRHLGCLDQRGLYLGSDESWKKSVSATARSMFGCGMPIANVFTACQELIVQSVDLARLMGRDILLMQGSQLMLGWLVIATIANRPWSLVK
jgi:hypothetical protein